MTDIIVGDVGPDLLSDADGTYVYSPYVPVLGHVDAEQAFFVAEIDIFQPGETPVFAPGWGVAPWGAFSFLAAAAETNATIYASDVGYRSAGPVVPYPPLIQDAFAIDAALPLDPGQVQIVWGWGTMRIANVDRQFDPIVDAWNMDGRRATIKRGIKVWDDMRGLFVDPPYASLETVFTGLAAPPLLSEFDLQIALRDPSYWLQRPLQRAVYAGTGTYEGPAELAGTTKPMLRGRRYNIPLVLIDGPNLIYQYTDGPGTVHNLYEGGGTTIASAGDTADLYSGSTPPGQFRHDPGRGLVQVGSTPAQQLTVDATGAFPVAGVVTVAAAIARYVMSEEMLLPAANLDAASFAAAAASYPYEAGLFLASGQAMDGVQAVAWLLGGFGAAVAPNINGALSCLVLGALPVGTVEVAAFDRTNIQDLVPARLPANLSPPPRRLRCAWRHNDTVQTTDLSGSATEDQRRFIATADRYAYWSSGPVGLAYANANDPDPFGGSLNDQVDAQAVVNRLGDLWAGRRRLFDLTVAVGDGIAREFGDPVRVTYPSYGLSTGALGQVVGRGLRSGDATMKLRVLI